MPETDSGDSPSEFDSFLDIVDFDKEKFKLKGMKLFLVLMPLRNLYVALEQDRFAGNIKDFRTVNHIETSLIDSLEHMLTREGSYTPT